MNLRELVLQALLDCLCPFRGELRDCLLTCRIHIVREDVRTFAGLSFSLLTDRIFSPAAATLKQDAIETLDLLVMQRSAFFAANPAPGGLPAKQLLVTNMLDLAKRNISVGELGMRRGVSAATAHNDAVRAGVASAAALDFLRDAGALTLLPLLVALFQLAIWLQPAWTPQPDATTPAWIERVHQEQHALSGKFDDLTAMLARHEADNLGSIPRAQVKRPARVRTGPSTASRITWRLEPGDVVGVRDRENGWVLVFYRDPLSGVVGSGWIYAALLETR